LLAAPRTKIKTQNSASGLVLELPPEAPDKIASVIELRVKGELKFAEAAK
jgi:hypothetical protein